MKKLSESIWSDIQKRSSGETVRKEDEINLLDLEGLYEYILSHYEIKHTYPQPFLRNTYFTIPLIIESTAVYRISIHFPTNKKIEQIFLHTYEKSCGDAIDYLKKQYDLDINPDKGINIKPKNGDLTNTDCLNVIDIIIANVDEPFLIKKGGN